MRKAVQHQEDGGARPSANDTNSQCWRTCPLCGEGGTQSPPLGGFLPLIHHLVEHETGGLRPNSIPIQVWDPLDDFREQIGEPRPVLDAKTCERMLVKAARKFLPSIADWLGQALEGLPELAAIQDAGIPTVERLGRLARSLPVQFKEQKTYLLQHEEALRDTGQDPKWPRTMGTQAKFVSESMAGAEWNLSPTTSREYVRRAKPRARSLRDKRKSYDRRPRRSDGSIHTDRDYDS